MVVRCCLLLLFVCLVFCDDGLVIDDFTIGAQEQSLSLVLSSTLTVDDPPIFVQSFYTGGNGTALIGGERDLELKVFSGLAQRTFFSEIFTHEWVFSAPKSCSSSTTAQYDGHDGSMEINLNGLNLNMFNYGDALMLSVVSDISTMVDVRFYSPDGDICEYNLNVPGTPFSYSYDDTLHYIPFSSISGGCSFNNIGALEVVIGSNDSMDCIAKTIQIVQVSPPTTPTPNPTPPPSYRSVKMIDNFANGASKQGIVAVLPITVNEDDTPLIFNSTYVKQNCVDLLGCGRDLLIEVAYGAANRVFSSEIFSIYSGPYPAEWAVSSPKSAGGYFNVQYDGMDNSTTLDLNGLENMDLTVGGTAKHLQLVIINDLAVNVIVNIFSPFGGVCSFDLFVPTTPNSYDESDIAFYVPLNQINGSCSVTDVGAIEFIIPFDDALDCIIRQIQLTT